MGDVDFADDDERRFYTALYANMNWRGRVRPPFAAWVAETRQEGQRLLAEDEADPVEWMGHVLVVCGIEGEAALFHRRTEAILMSGGSATKLADSLEWMAAKEHTAAALSAGLAGALDQSLKAGDVVAAKAIHDGHRVYPTDPEWLERLVAATGARVVDCVLGSDTVIDTPARKAELFARTGAAIVDMESQVLAPWAAAQGVATGVLRVVSDDARHGLSPSAVAGMGDDGKVHVRRVVASLARRPQDLPGLIRTSGDVRIAMAALGRAAQAAGRNLGFPEARILVRRTPEPSLGP